MKWNENDLRMALRYAHIKDEKASLFRDWLMALEPVLQEVIMPKVTWRVFSCQKEEDGIALEPGHLVLPGNLAKSMLRDCQQVIVAAASLGHGFDRQTSLYEAGNEPARALLWDAAGSVWIEKVMDELETVLKARPEFENRFFTDRFSCGYGDLPLALQKEIGALLNLPLRCGIQVLDSCMMAPTKSITAFIGVADKPQPARIRGCAVCSMNRQCTYRQKGKTCHES